MLEPLQGGARDQDQKAEVEEHPGGTVNTALLPGWVGFLEVERFGLAGSGGPAR